MAEIDPATAKEFRPVKGDHQAAVAACAALLGNGTRVRDVVDPDDPRRLLGVVRVLAEELLATVAREAQSPEDYVMSWGLRTAELADDAPAESGCEVPELAASAPEVGDFPTDSRSLGGSMEAVLAAASAARAGRAFESWTILRGVNPALAAQTAVSLFATVLDSLDPADAELRMVAWYKAARELKNRK